LNFLKMNMPFIHKICSVLIVIIFLSACSTSRQVQNENQQSEVLLNSYHRDNLGNFYSKVSDRLLQKFDEKGLLEREFSHPDLTGITSVNVSDPYKIALFYKDRQKIIILDNTLNQVSSMDLSEISNTYIQLVGRSEDGDFWIFDGDNDVLLKIGHDMEIMDESYPLYQEGISGFSGTELLANSKLIILGDATGMILLFDHLGNFHRKINVESYLDLELVRNSILITRENAISIYNLEIYEENHFFTFKANQSYTYSIDKNKSSLILFEEGERLQIQNEIAIP